MKITIEEVPETEVRLIRIEGRLDSYTNKVFEETIDKLFSEGHNCLVIDISNLNYINSTGLGTIVGLHLRASVAGGVVALFGAQGKVAMIIRVTRVEKELKIFEIEEEAVRAATCR